VLLIAHRLTAMAAADRVAVLSQGRLIEQGAPEALAESGRVYPRLLAAWRGTA
jgi:ABC-type multidrug transport system fused ATPase/permease subunit